MEAREEADREQRSAGVGGLLEHPRSTPPAPRQGRRTCSMPFRCFRKAAAGSGLSRPGQRVAMSARSEAPAAGRAGLMSPAASNGSFGRWRPSMCERKAARGSRRRLGGAAGQGMDHEDKIAAIGVRLRRLVVVPRHLDQRCAEPGGKEHFYAIVPAAWPTRAYGVTSLDDLGLPMTFTCVEGWCRIALTGSFEEGVFFFSAL